LLFIGGLIQVVKSTALQTNYLVQYAGQTHLQGTTPIIHKTSVNPLEFGHEHSDVSAGVQE
jgi:hypothetical protein